MYGLLRRVLDPTERGFGLPAKYVELRRQLGPIPLDYDGEGRMMMMKKRKPANSTSKERTLIELLGCSPDEADSLVVAIYSMMNDDLPFEVKVW